MMFATLGFNELVRVPSGMEPALRALHGWLSSWRGIGEVVPGMGEDGRARQRGAARALDNMAGNRP
jgi:hypothetical protein